MKVKFDEGSKEEKSPRDKVTVIFEESDDEEQWISSMKHQDIILKEEAKEYSLKNPTLETKDIFS